jgi:hypothetical protein
MFITSDSHTMRREYKGVILCRRPIISSLPHALRKCKKQDLSPVTDDLAIENQRSFSLEFKSQIMAELMNGESYFT